MLYQKKMTNLPKHIDRCGVTHRLLAIGCLLVGCWVSDPRWSGVARLDAAERSTSSAIEGFTEPYHKVELAPSEPGTLAELRVREGDAVKRGQELASLDNDVLVVARDIARLSREAHGQLDAAAAEVQLRRARFDKLEALRQRTHASQDEVDRARTELLVAEANRQTALEQRAINELEVRKAEAQIERRVLRSPFDGVVTAIHKEVREYVPANAPQVLTIVQLDPLRVTFSLPTSLALQFKQGQSLEVSLPEFETTAPATVEFVSPVTEADSGTVRVKVLIDNPAGRYRAGVRATLPGFEMPQVTQATTLAPQLSLP